MITKSFCKRLKTKCAPEFIDITEWVTQCVAESEISNGFAVVYSKHTTAAVKINENEPLLLKDMAVIKLILMGIAIATIGIYALDLVDMANMSIKPTYVVGIAVAGLIFGVGFAVAGYCPGTCIVAAAEGKTDAVVTIAGGLAGTLIYSLVYPAMKGLIGMTNYGEVTVPSVLGVTGLWVAIPFSAVLLLLVFKVLKDRYE
ncbi:MAG: YeeE/YedE family protein [Chloroflexi bacterium]|nr:YeeE/YedE family protein [Chloroflexota bacterium]